MFLVYFLNLVTLNWSYKQLKCNCILRIDHCNLFGICNTISASCTQLCVSPWTTKFYRFGFLNKIYIKQFPFLAAASVVSGAWRNASSS